MTALFRTLLALGIAVTLYLIVKKIFVAFGLIGWDRMGIMTIESYLIAIVAASVVASELVHLGRAFIHDADGQLPDAHAIRWRDVALLFFAMLASFLVVIALFTIAHRLGEPLPRY